MNRTVSKYPGTNPPTQNIDRAIAFLWHFFMLDGFVLELKKGGFDYHGA
jgi:hypothetical protein